MTQLSARRRPLSEEALGRGPGRDDVVAERTDEVVDESACGVAIELHRLDALRRRLPIRRPEGAEVNEQTIVAVPDELHEAVDLRRMRMHLLSTVQNSHYSGHGFLLEALARN